MAFLSLACCVVAIALAVPVTLRQPVRRFHAIALTRRSVDLHLHQPLGSKRDNPA